MPWQEFEIECTNYLNEKYSIPDKVNFIHMGAANSTVSDIKVEINGNSKFFVEVKMNASQCGQFVLIPDLQNKCFIFSERNESVETPVTKKIIALMNKNFENYISGGILNMNNALFYEWVIEHYRKLGAKYIITRYEDEYLIFPIDKFSEYFTIKGVYRIKRSGSRSPSRNQQKQFVEMLTNAKVNFSYEIIDDELIVKSDSLRRGSRFNIDNNTYWLAEHQLGLRVRILSKTANSNVIFSIFLKKHTQDNSDLSMFIADLK